MLAKVANQKEKPGKTWWATSDLGWLAKWPSSERANDLLRERECRRLAPDR